MPRADRHGLTAGTRRFGGTALGSALIGGMLLLSSRSPDSLPFVPCPFRAATGFLCPFCGTTRATHELLHGDFGDALALNPLGTVFVPIALAFVAWIMLVPLLRGRPIRHVVVSRSVALLGAAAIAAVWVFRNIPSVWPWSVTA